MATRISVSIHTLNTDRMEVEAVPGHDHVKAPYIRIRLDDVTIFPTREHAKALVSMLQRALEDERVE